MKVYNGPKINETFFNLILILLLFNIIFSEEIKTCPRNKPILISGKCNLTYCSQAQYVSRQCIKANSTIETQWLNNIITFGENNYRYLAFGSYSSGDMVVQTTCFPTSTKRIFYGLQQNGRPLFTKNNKETHFYYKTSNEGQYELEGFVIKSSDSTNNGNEYFLSFSKLDGYAEIYDFKNDKVYSKSVTDFTGVDRVKTYRHAIAPLFSPTTSTTNYYYIIGVYGSTSSNSNELLVYFHKHIFSSINNFGSTKTYNTNNKKTYENAYGNDISCFQTTSEFIICFYLILKSNNKKTFYLHKFDNNLSDEKTATFETNYFIEKLFYKCIHLKENIGIFSYYYKYSDNNIYPFFLFKEFKNNQFKDFLPSSYTDSKLVIKKTDFSNTLFLTDLIKINDNKVAFVSPSQSREILNIIILNIFGDIKIKIRYYSIALYALYHYKILSDLRINKYNNYLSIAFSYCPIFNCTDDSNEHYTALMVFSYPNSTDITINLEKYIFDNNIIPRIFEVNLTQYLRLENNIFGYILSNIYIRRIIGENNNCIAYSSKDELTVITENYIMEKDEKIIFKFIGGDNYFPKINKTIEYYFNATKPEYNIYDTYPDKIEGDNDESDFNNEEYFGRLSYYNIKSDIEFVFSCPKTNCNLCKKGIETYCVVCKNEYNLSETDGKICHFDTDLIETTEPITENPTETKAQKETQFLTEQITEKLTEHITDELTDSITEQKADKLTDQIIEIINDNSICSIQDILKNKCLDILITEEQLKKIFNLLKNDYLNDNYKGNNTIIQTLNTAFQISTLKDQKNSNNPNISNIDLGECEQKLKNHFKINEDLIIFKTDIKSEDLTQTFVQYEIYDPRDLSILNLTICKDIKISVNSPVKLDSSTSFLYDILKDSGYNLFNENDAFYIDVCSTYTSQNGTDMTLNDRKKEIYCINGNLSLCQSGCELESYNSTTKKAKCECSPQIKEVEVSLNSPNDKFNYKELTSSFMSTLKNSNFLVLKCYKLAIDFKNFWTNIGRIIMTIILFLSLILLFIFIIRDNKNINNIISNILNNRLNLLKNSNKSISKEKKVSKNNDKNNKNESKNKSGKIKKNNNKTKKINFSQDIKKSRQKKKSLSNKINKQKNKENNSISSKLPLYEDLFKRNSKKNSSKINIIKINHYSIKNVVKGKNIIINNINKDGKNSVKNKNLKNKKSNQFTHNKDNSIIKAYSKDKLKDLKNNPIYTNLNDLELNTLEYELAILIDKRTYFQYYWSLLKKKHLILFTFIPANDYNLITIKICLFLLSFSLFFTINGFFFSDDTMHKIHEDKGKFNFIFQIPQILYSTIITAVINLILKQLSLSENDIISLKKKKDIKRMKNYSKQIKKCIVIKFIIYFILNNIFLLFFWYFISCFCAVYKNTQIILIKDTLFSFGLSMLYPFGLNLLPGILRIPALKSQKKDRKFLYKLSTLLALI